MEREEFQRRCRQAASRPGGVIQTVAAALSERDNDKAGKLPVIWIEADDSGDNVISFMNTTFPYLGQVFGGLMDLLYSNSFMAAQGDRALAILRRSAEAYRGRFVLVVEGAIPLKDEGRYTLMARTLERDLTTLEVVSWLGPLARYVVATGTCASFGGPTAARPNITGSVAVSQVLDRPVIKVSGCPVNSDWLVGTLAHLLLYGEPELDELGRPLLFYAFTVHRHCQRRSYFDDGVFAEELGDIECMFSQGCVGPRTPADCPYRE